MHLMQLQIPCVQCELDLFLCGYHPGYEFCCWHQLKHWYDLASSREMAQNHISRAMHGPRFLALHDSNQLSMGTTEV